MTSFQQYAHRRGLILSLAGATVFGGVLCTRTASGFDPGNLVPSGGTAGPTLSGEIRYYRGDSTVSGVTVALEGSNEESITDTDGSFAFPEVLEPAVALVPSRSIPFDLDGVTSADASIVLQFLVEKIRLDDLQALACDVTGDGSIDEFDADTILRWIVRKIDRFPVAEACGSDWLFVPDPDPALGQTLFDPGISSDMCEPGSIAFDPLTASAQGQDFLGIKIGDCNGDAGR